jgi:hypothetical protein
MDVNGQIHTLAVLSSKKETGIYQTGGQIGPTTGIVSFREENVHF